MPDAVAETVSDVQYLPATEIPVTLFRQILIWPLVVARAGETAPEKPEELPDTVRNLLRQPRLQDERTGWTEVEHLLGYLEPDTKVCSPEAYQEFVYFHPFVQRFLYDTGKGKGKGKEQDRLSPFTLFRRTDLCSVEVELRREEPAESIKLRFQVSRLHLYVTNTANLMLVLELESTNGQAVVKPEGGTEPMKLADAQAFMDYFRRTYPPFWDGQNADGSARAGKCPLMVTWHWRGQHAFCSSRMPSPEVCTAHVGDHGTAPVAEYWRQLLEPLTFPGCRSSEKNGLELRHVMDERMPVMTLIGTPEPRFISRGDWVRVAYVDDPGDVNGYPYGRSVLKNFEKDNCFDYFWDRQDKVMTTRHMITSYSYAILGRDDGPDNWSFLRHILQHHFRRHYFQLALIANFHHAALLTLSDRLSQAVDEFGANRRRSHQLEKAIHRVQWDILHFTHRYWFEDVTSQFQGRELFRGWRKHLQTQRLFDQVAREVAESDRFLGAEEQREQTVAALLLNRVGAFGLSLALAVGVLGMNILIPNTEGQKPIPAFWERELAHWTIFASIFVVGAVWVCASLWLHYISPLLRHDWIRFPSVIVFAIVVFLVTRFALLSL